MNPRLLIVRHGQTDWNSDGRFQGQTDVPLNAVGLEQAAAVARRLSRIAGVASDASQIAAVYASDLRRAWQTAEIVHAALPGCEHIPLVAEPRLRELSFGDWEGLTYAEIQARFPDDLRRWHAEFEQTTPPNGEAFPAFHTRVDSVYRSIAEAHPEQTALVVAHGGPLQALIAIALGIPAAHFWQFHLSNASLSELRIYPEGAVLNLLNDCTHLEETPVSQNLPPQPEI